jgi:hypothetical protein
VNWPPRIELEKDEARKHIEEERGLLSKVGSFGDPW